MNLSSSVNATPSKKRIIIVTVVMGLVVLGLLVTVISVAIGKIQKKPVADAPISGEVAVDQYPSASQNEQPAADPATENLAPVPNNETSGSTQSDSNSNIIAISEEGDNAALPSTGPADFIPAAILLGTLTTYLCSTIQAKRKSFCE